MNIIPWNPVRFFALLPSSLDDQCRTGSNRSTPTTTTLTIYSLLLSASVAAQSSAAERFEKVAGTFFDKTKPDAITLTNPIRNTPLSSPIPSQEQTSQSTLPPLQVKILMERDASVKKPLEKFLTESSAGYKDPSPLRRQLTLTNSAPEIIASALENPGVIRVEVARPPALAPVPPPSGFGRLRPFNMDAQITHLVPQFLSTFSDVTEFGRTIVAAVFDEGAIRASHVEFRDNRVAVRGRTVLSEHSTHVGGTMAARGVRGQATGMAKEMKLLSFDWENDLNVLQSVAPEIRISNHSYGPHTGWSFDSSQRVWLWWGNRAHSALEDSQFGKYTMENQLLDEILFNSPHLLTFVAAGNDRNDSPQSQPVYHFAINVNPQTGRASWESSTEVRNPDGFDSGGLDTITGLGLSKNAICIGAINDVAASGANIVTTEFSGWGPADDGRIKPDLVANGQNLLSTSKADDRAYISMPGTSMASPTAGGIAALLVEQFDKTHQRWPTAAEIKAILIHSATDPGQPGPDPVYGWGSINTLAAGRLIAGNDGATIETNSITTGHIFRKRLRTASHSSPIRVTLVWTDPAGTANSGGIDDATPVLVNDLDLLLVAPDGQKQFPYSLSRANPAAATRTSPNRVDNVEVVDAAHLPGEWEIVVSAERGLSTDRQPFALVITGTEAAH